MITPDKERALREHLALISTEVYLLLQATEESEHIERYNAVQAQIDAIVGEMDHQQPAHNLCSGSLFQ